VKNDWKPAYGFIGCVFLLSSVLHAVEKCSAEAKLLLSPQTVKTVISSLSFEKKATVGVYFFDTSGLDLLKQGVIVRVRQGAINDLTVKVRAPEGNKELDAAQLSEHFPCETNQTGAGEGTDYSIQRKYKVPRMIPEMGSDIASVFSPAQQRLLKEARVSVDWSRVKRIADIQATKWETTTQSPFRKLTLELWEWPAGTILEISTKIAADVGQPNYAELRRLVEMKGLALSASQGNKTSMVLGTSTSDIPRR
jgi:hypothetical protein